MGASFSIFVNVAQVISVILQLIQLVPDIDRIARYYRQAWKAMRKVTSTSGELQRSESRDLVMGRVLTGLVTGIRDDALASEEGRYWYTSGGLDVDDRVAYTASGHGRATEYHRQVPRQPNDAHLRYRPSRLQRRMPTE